MSAWPPTEAMSHCRALWQVESAFRVTGHDLRVRPVFHWTPRRVHAHPAIAFMTLLRVRHLAWRLRLRGTPMSPEVVRTALAGVRCSILRDTRSGVRLVLPSSMSPEAGKLHISPSHDLVPREIERPPRQRRT